jgi:DNA-binding LacI/PurR family transcriptional regulator
MLPSNAFALDTPLAPAGIFFFGSQGAPLEDENGVLDRNCARVVYVDAPYGQLAERNIDQIFFNDYIGGYEITRYLQQQGHDRIAFMGLHGAAESEGPLSWSRKRMAGWSQAMSEGGRETSGLTFLPPLLPKELINIAGQEQISAELGQRLIEPLRSGDISAVVTVNVHAAHGLFEALHAANFPSESWPIVTTFGIGDSNDSMMTSMVLPWNQLGREAAELLWNRSRGTVEGLGRQIPIPMRLITRLTCQPSWKMRPEFALWENFSRSGTHLSTTI